MAAPVTQTNRSNVIEVMISSSALDLPEHRKAVLDACLRQGMFPFMMEHLPTSDADAIATSLRMVEEADIYLGIFAYRYGRILKGHSVSVTEMEYNHAVERGIPRLIFLMHKDHPLKVSYVETGKGATKLEALKARMKTELVVSFFKSPQELQAQVINALSYYRRPDLTAFHYVSDITNPPEPYIAHPSTLLQTQQLVGRQAELNQLTDWVARFGSTLYQARILSVVAIGGMGKSALTWKWFHDIAPNEMQPLAGRLWWSFYESDATFENFVIRALAYVSRGAKEDIQKLPPPEREEQLLSILDREPYLFVLDGLERLLIAYARMDASRLADDDLDQRTANVVAGALGLPKSADESFIGQHRLRKSADMRTGAFLRKLAYIRSSRILITTRLYPADLQTDTGTELAGCAALFLQGLSDDDALNLWRAFGISGSRETLVPLFHTFDNQPLLIQVLAGEVSHDRRAPGDFDQWRKNHPGFTPFGLPLVQVKSHVLEFALRGLDQATREVLMTIAAFRMPATYDTLVALFVGEDKPCKSEDALVAILAELEDRGLLGWDRRANRYDLHPIVRGIVWASLGSQTQHGIYETLSTHFASLPAIDDYRQVEQLEDLTAAIELYNTLVGLDRYDDAVSLYRDRLSKALLYRLGASRQSAELLALLFPAGLEQLPRLSEPGDRAFVLNALALSLANTGQPGQAVALLRRSTDIYKSMGDKKNMSITLDNLSNAQRITGALYEAEAAAHRAFLIAQQLRDQEAEVHSLNYMGLALAARGRPEESERALERSLALPRQDTAYRPYDFQAMRAVWLGEYGNARVWAEQAMTYNLHLRNEREIIVAARLQGEAALGLGDLSTAEERLHHALFRARTVNLVEEELAALIGLVELRRRQGDLKAARELLDDVWEPAERGPYRLFHADAYNVLVQIERDAGDHEAAVKAAMEAYRLAWCDGPPFAYHRGLQNSKTHLAALRAPEPVLSSFDVEKFALLPIIDDWQKVESLEELTSAIELYNTLVDLGRYDEAAGLFRERLDNSLLEQLGASRQRAELLALLFHDGLEHLPLLTDLERQESSTAMPILQRVQRLENLIGPVMNSIANNIPVDGIEEQIGHILQVFSSSVGLGEVKKQDCKDLIAYSIETGSIFENLRMPNPLPVLISLDKEVSDRTIEHLRRILLSGVLGAGTHIAILLLFCEKKNLDMIKQRILQAISEAYAYDIAVINHEGLLEIVSAREPERILRHSVLSQVSLASVSPYTITGPTPVHFFFGREAQLREISEHIATTSYIILGGRRIGKTSIVSCLHNVRLPALGYTTIYYDCSKTPTIKDFLSAPIRDWKPVPPANAPATFEDLLGSSFNEMLPVLLLDEADKLVPVDRSNNWQLLNTLRALANSRHIQFVLSGERTLREALKDATGPLFNFGNEILLGPLNYRDVEELVTRPMKLLEIEIVDKDAIVRQIYDFTSGHPNVVQRLCYRLTERLDSQNVRHITLNDVIAITKDPAFLEIDFLQTYWEAATPLEKIITLVLSQKTGDYRMAQVRELLSEQAYIRPSVTEMKDALDRLVELRSILKRSQNGYTFAVESFPRILVDTTAVEDLLEVFIEQYNKTEHRV